MASRIKRFVHGNSWYDEMDRLHRLDGPAVEYNNGHKEWYKHGQLHRLDGPAIEYTYGYKAYYINGKEYLPLFIDFDKIIEKIESHGK